MEHPIFDHVKSGELSALQKIIDNEPSCVNLLNYGGLSPLIIAALDGRWQAVRLLLSRHADISHAPDGYTALHTALETPQDTFDGLPPEWPNEKPDREKTTNLLLNAGINPNSQDIDGQTPLHAAANGGITGCVKILLEHGANPNSRNMNGATPLIFAAQNGYTEIVELLLQAGADISIPDNNGWQPWRVARANKHFDLMEKLLVGMHKDKFIRG